METVRGPVLPIITRREPIRAWIIDDAGFPRTGTHSVGVVRQYCGQPGKQDNCHVAVSLPVADELASLPVACRVHLSESRAEDPTGRARAGVPDAVTFETKAKNALDQIRQAKEAGIPTGIMLANAFRTGPRATDLNHVAGAPSPPACGRRDKDHCHPNPEGNRAASLALLPRPRAQANIRQGSGRDIAR